jgi:hypothetical protein
LGLAENFLVTSAFLLDLAENFLVTPIKKMTYKERWMSGCEKTNFLCHPV